MNVFYLSSGYDGCCYLRLYLPCIHNGYKTDKPSRIGGKIPAKAVSQLVRGSDVVVFHRAEEPEYYDLAKMLKKDGVKIVMDNDDTFKLADTHPLANFQPDGSAVDNLQRRSDNLDKFMKLSDMVTTSTEFLAKEYRAVNPNVRVLPNCVNPQDWDTPLKNETDKVRIGIVGSAALEYDYIHVKDTLRALSARNDVELVLFGLGDKKHRKNNPTVTKVFKEEYAFWDSLNIDHFPWVKNHVYQEALNDMRLDFMIVPRKDNYFNRCKSNVKFLEAAMLEIPVIAQSFKDGPYEEILHKQNGILIRRNEMWETEINNLIKHKYKREYLGRNAKQYVLDNYNIEDKAYLWEEAYTSLFNK